MNGGGRERQRNLITNPEGQTSSNELLPVFVHSIPQCLCRGNQADHQARP